MRSTNWKETDERWLNNDQPITEEQQDSPVRRLNRIRLRNLRVEFRKQHTHTLACAEGSSSAVQSKHRIPSEKNVPRDIILYDIERALWGLKFDTDYTKAWDSGTSVMRNLLAGKVPSSLNDTIMFLAMAKAMYLSGSAPALSTWHSNFASHVGRWQMLFKSDIGSLFAFQEAVSSIW